MKKKNSDYRSCGMERIAATKKPTEKSPKSVKKAAGRDLRVKGG